MRCGTAREWITAAIDGELPVRQRHELEAHLAGCPDCTTERTRTARLLGAVAALAAEPTLPPRLEQDTLRRVRQLAAADAERRAAPAGRRMGRWLGIAAPALAAAAALVLALRPAEPPGPVAVVAPPPAPSTAPPVRVARPAAPPVRERAPAAARPAPPADAATAVAQRPAAPSDAPRSPDAGTSEPPPELIARPDLYRDLPILQNLEKLENYDAIETTTLDAGQRGPNG